MKIMNTVKPHNTLQYKIRECKRGRIITKIQNWNVHFAYVTIMSVSTHYLENASPACFSFASRCGILREYLKKMR
jgi:hypothetical protein